MTRFRQAFIKPLRWLTIALFSMLVLSVIWQIFSRELLNLPSTWTDELARYSFVWASLIGTALVFLETGHIAVEFLRRKFGGAPRKAIEVISFGTVAFISSWLLIFGGLASVLSTWNQNASALPVQIGKVYLVMPIAGVIITVFALHDAYLAIRGSEWNFNSQGPVPLMVDGAQVPTVGDEQVGS